jgi:hypothetical protein
MRIPPGGCQYAYRYGPVGDFVVDDQNGRCVVYGPIRSIMRMCNMIDLPQPKWIANLN